ncbi:MAG: glutamate-cysteine ligase family protein, partial [Coriobacteriia bacterium]|nr:glutamate-cysteine ligase family protein [Coriobacteriia bacterium]
MDVFFQQYKPASSIANYLNAGSKSSGVKTIGLELEHFVVHKESHALVPYMVERGSSEPSVEQLLEQLKQLYDNTHYEDDSEGVSRLFGMCRKGVCITLEPGAQLEVSIGPCCSVAELESIYEGFRSEIDPLLESKGLQLLELGYHPTSLARDIPILPKLRYAYMDKYFSDTGKHGMCMMRATASTQISIDYESQDDALLKFRVANALGPLFAFITDNTPIFEKEQVGVKGGTASKAASDLPVPKRMARMTCWDDTDPLRSLVAKGTFGDGFSFVTYAEGLLEAPSIFLPQSNAAEKPSYQGFTPFKQLLPNEFIDEELVGHILSLFFYDVRFKNYVELRQADALPLRYALSFAALVYGIFYNPPALDYYESCFSYIDIPAIAFAKSSLRNNGYQANVYGRPATEWLDELICWA